MNVNNFFRYYLPVITWTIFILAITSYPDLQVPDTGVDAQDKIAHFGVYFILGFLTSRALWRGKRLTISNSISYSLFGCCVLAIMNEWYQQFIPGRSSELLDAIANIAGVLAAQFLFSRYVKYIGSMEYNL